MVTRLLISFGGGTSGSSSSSSPSFSSISILVVLREELRRFFFVLPTSMTFNGVTFSVFSSDEVPRSRTSGTFFFFSTLFLRVELRLLVFGGIMTSSSSSDIITFSVLLSADFRRGLRRRVGFGLYSSSSGEMEVFTPEPGHQSSSDIVSAKMLRVLGGNSLVRKVHWNCQSS